jgi:tetrahydromethanopterin S-methyltransferase subunit D
MSSVVTPAARSVRQPATRSPRLAVVPQSTATAPRVPFVALVVALLGVGLVGLLVLNTSLQRGAYVATSLRTSSADLTLREQNLQVQVDRLASPERLATLAAARGMVRTDSPAFLSLATGKVVGVPKPGKAGNSVGVYGGGAAPASSKVADVPAGSHNSASSGIHRSARVAPRQPNAPTKQRRSRPPTVSTGGNAR